VVHAGAVRLAIIAACNPLVQDAAITGHDRDEVGALLFVNPAVIQTLGLTGAALRAHLQRALVELRSTSTGSTVPTRLLVLEEPPSIDGNEITDKGYLNQRATLTRRAAHVEELRAGGPGAITV
jgi:feruloyl-CoA synthase